MGKPPLDIAAYFEQPIFFISPEAKHSHPKGE
jgi:hypothetical protein